MGLFKGCKEKDVPYMLPCTRVVHWLISSESNMRDVEDMKSPWSYLVSGVFMGSSSEGTTEDADVANR